MPAEDAYARHERPDDAALLVLDSTAADGGPVRYRVERWKGRRRQAPS
jgi:hypothetical protein